MIEESHPQRPATLAEQVQALGFEPSQLTPEEQRELLEVHLLLSQVPVPA